ncbi:MAG: hypothetical protein ACT4QB_22945 [Gammaproteobacteria bacterium]
MQRDGFSNSPRRNRDRANYTAKARIEAAVGMVTRQDQILIAIPGGDQLAIRL